jgi:outer membrane protein OmpA-like peptidoglycan-associated protein
VHCLRVVAEELSLPFAAASSKLGAKAKADLAFVITTLKRQKTLKLRVCGCTLHTEAPKMALERARAVVAVLTEKGVLKQQLRAEARPPEFGQHGTSAACFVVVQSMFLPKRLSFADGSTDLPSVAPPMLDKVKNTLDAHADLDLVLEGHTDSREPQPTELSGRRAVSVKKFLVAAGVAANRLNVVAVGGACPVATNLTAQGRRHNRRVEIQIRVRS